MYHQSQLTDVANKHGMRVKDFCNYLNRPTMAIGSAKRKFKKLGNKP